MAATYQGTVDSEELLPEGGRADVESLGDRTGTQPQAERRVHGKHPVGQMRRPRLWQELSAQEWRRE